MTFSLWSTSSLLKSSSQLQRQRKTPVEVVFLTLCLMDNNISCRPFHLVPRDSHASLTGPQDSTFQGDPHRKIRSAPLYWPLNSSFGLGQISSLLHATGSKQGQKTEAYSWWLEKFKGQYELGRGLFLPFHTETFVLARSGVISVNRHLMRPAEGQRALCKID